MTVPFTSHFSLDPPAVFEVCGFVVRAHVGSIIVPNDWSRVINPITAGRVAGRRRRRWRRRRRSRHAEPAMREGTHGRNGHHGHEQQEAKRVKACHRVEVDSGRETYLGHIDALGPRHQPGRGAHEMSPQPIHGSLEFWGPGSVPICLSAP